MKRRFDGAASLRRSTARVQVGDWRLRRMDSRPKLRELAKQLPGAWPSSDSSSGGLERATCWRALWAEGRKRRANPEQRPRRTSRMGSLACSFKLTHALEWVEMSRV